MKKTCKRCREEKPRSEFSKQKLTKDGLQSWCKECSRAAGRERRQKPRTEPVRCSDCGFVKPPSEFSGVRAICKPCHNKRQRCEYRGEPPPPYEWERLLEEGLKRCPRCDEIKPVERFSRHGKTRDGLRTQCKGCESVGQRSYYEENPDKRCARDLRRRASEAGAIPSNYTEAEDAAIGEFRANCPEGDVVDHIVPLRGRNISGLQTLSNLRYLRAEDNGPGRKWNGFNSSFIKKGWLPAECADVTVGPTPWSPEEENAVADECAALRKEKERYRGVISAYEAADEDLSELIRGCKRTEAGCLERALVKETEALTRRVTEKIANIRVSPRNACKLFSSHPPRLRA